MACSAFTLVETLVVVVLLAFIVLALMAVFNSTQAAFRASITQTDVLEGGRSVMGLIKSDLETMAPSFGTSNLTIGAMGAVNFNANTNSSYLPLVQSLVSSGYQRTNVLENVFILGRANLNGQDSWLGAGYTVAPSADGIYSLYRFATNHPVMSWNPTFIFTNEYQNFLTSVSLSAVNSTPVTNGSRLMDGVVHLTVRPYDPNGRWMTNYYVVDYYSGLPATNWVRNAWFGTPVWGEAPFCLFSNTLPATVEVELAVLEDHAIQRAESLPNVAPAWVQSNYLAQQSGKVHLFRQRVLIRNVDPSAYQ